MDAVRAAVADEAERCHALIDELRRQAEAACAEQAAAVFTFLVELSELVEEELEVLGGADRLDAGTPAVRPGA